MMEGSGIMGKDSQHVMRDTKWLRLEGYGSAVAQV